MGGPKRQDVAPVVLELLSRGCATSAGIQAITGISQSTICGTLCRLEEMGRVKRADTVQGQTARKIILWGLAEPSVE